jgi:hypothetical protein
MRNAIAIRYQSSLQDETGYILDSFDFATIGGERGTLTVPHDVGVNARQLHYMLMRRGAQLPVDSRNSMYFVQRLIKDGPIQKMRYAHGCFEIF